VCINKTNELISKLKTIFVNRKISTYRKQIVNFKVKDNIRKQNNEYIKKTNELISTLKYNIRKQTHLERVMIRASV